MDLPATSDNIPGTLVLRDNTGGFNAAGNVGIGTTSPQARLEIVGGGNPLRFTGTGVNTTGGIEFFNSVEKRAEIAVGANPGNIVIHSDPNNVAASSRVAVAVDGVEAVRIVAGGNVGVGTMTPNASALIDVSSTTLGFLPPRMTTAQRDAISTPPAGLMIYNTTTNKLNVRTASSWEAVTSA